MVLKSTWVAGELYTAADQNDIATAVNAVKMAPTAVKTSAYTAVVGDLIPADATAGGFTVTLPSAPADQSCILVKKLDATANTVTVQRGGATDVFNVAAGATTLQLVLQDQTVLLQYNTSGGIWYVTAHGMPPASLDTRYVTPAGVQTLTLKTLTSPKVNEIRDTNGNVIFSLTQAAAAINYVGVGNASSGAPYFAVAGGETDIALDFYTKGLGSFRMRDGNSARLLQADTIAAAVNYPLVSNSATGSRVKYGAAGTDANIDTDITSKGTGVVRVNNIPVVTTTGAQALTSKTATLAAGTTSVAPLQLTSGTNLTTPAAGAFEYDGTVFYLTPAASTRHVSDAEQFITLTTAYTTPTSTAAAQKLFNSPVNGAVTLGIGTYFFECYFDLSAMSSATGVFGWTLAAGTATIAGIKWYSEANKAALATAAAPQVTANTAANTAIVTTSISTVGWAKITGKVRISTAGTVIPQFSLGVAATAVVGVDSYFRIWSVGSSTVQSVGNWS